MEVKGHNGSIVFDGKKIIIKRNGVVALLTQGFKGDKEIYIKQISSIQLKQAGLLTSGYIQFAFSGGKENKGGLLDAGKDENTVIFTKKQQPDFLKLKEELEKAILNQNTSTTTIKNNSNLEELEKLASLKDKGIITNEEFEIKKKELLGL